MTWGHRRPDWWERPVEFVGAGYVVGCVVAWAWVVVQALSR